MALEEWVGSGVGGEDLCEEGGFRVVGGVWGQWGRPGGEGRACGLAWVGGALGGV